MNRQKVIDGKGLLIGLPPWEAFVRRGQRYQAVAMCRPDMPVDVLFTDIQLNDTINGWEVAEAFRAERGNILVIYTSGNPIEPARCVAGSLYFNKPYRPADILTACQRFKI